ncbi:MAG: DNA-directed DNA polymerase II small subunit [Candidatus Thermoplasmatota archaeon]|nr:DNA-directed DNA polymerase II small subunit [Candidatus Thermoplasmatota archaeon]
MEDPSKVLAGYNRLLTPGAAAMLSDRGALLSDLVSKLDSGCQMPFIIGESDLEVLNRALTSNSSAVSPATIAPMARSHPSEERPPPAMDIADRSGAAIPRTGPSVSPLQTETVAAITGSHKAGSIPMHGRGALNISRSGSIRGRPFDASDIAGDVRILFDPSEVMGNKGRIEDFNRLFQDRFRVMRDMLRRNHAELDTLEDIGSLAPMEEKARIVGMVQGKRRTKNGHMIYEIEDPTGMVKVLVSKNKEIDRIIVVEDETVGVVGRYNKDRGSESGIIFADELYRADIPVPHARRQCSDKGCIAAFISDIHAGSRHFLNREWNSMISWLNGNDTGSISPDIARRIKYLVVCGDLVDGIGIYPDQDKDLDIKDISKQYELLAELLSGVPSHIHVVMIPGNHDSVRLAEPQPPIEAEYRDCFSNDNIHFLTNPAFLSLSGIRVTAYHGKSLDDMVQLYKDVTYEDPLEGMKEMLRSRHMALTYGMRNQLSPEEADSMILREVPDVFVTGHVHRFGYGDHMGVRMIQAGTWQSQTSFQKMMNFKPQPAMMALLDLSTWDMHTWTPKGLLT